MREIPSNPKEREIYLNFSFSDIDPDFDSSPESRAAFVLRGVGLCWQKYRARMIDINDTYQPNAQAKPPIVAQELADLETSFNRAKQTLQVDVIQVREQLVLEAAIQKPEKPIDGAILADWLFFLERATGGFARGAYLERQQLALEILVEGDLVGYTALKNAGPVRLAKLLGDKDYFAENIVPRWEDAKLDPKKKTRIAFIAGQISTIQKKMKEIYQQALALAGRAPTAEQIMRDRLQEDNEENK